jgi:hypothetical protein
MSQIATTPRAPIVVLGMHRSGTSALARSLRELGAWLGSERNITPRCEHALAQECNQAILNRLGGHWSAPVPMPEGWTSRPELAPIDADARAAVADLEQRAPAVWKDPRTCHTLAYWRERFALPPVAIVSYRHPLEVAASLDRRNHFGSGHVLALWESYNRALLASAAGLRCIVVAYADLATEPVATLTAVCDALAGYGYGFDRTPEQGAATVDADRRHHVFVDLPDDVATPQQRALWDALRALPAVSECFAPPGLPAPHPAAAELLASRAATIRCERDLAAAQATLRSRRALLGRLAQRLVRPSTDGS